MLSCFQSDMESTNQLVQCFLRAHNQVLIITHPTFLQMGEKNGFLKCWGMFYIFMGTDTGAAGSKGLGGEWEI